MTTSWTPIVGKAFSTFDFDDYVKSLSFEAWKPEFVVVHNTWDPTFKMWHAVPGASRMRGLEKYYSSPPPEGMGWSAGPHLFVSDDVVWAFTPLTVPGVHSPSWNRISWGVETTGDWTTEVVPEALMNNLVDVLATLHNVAGIDPGTLKFHHEDPATTHHDCPGVNLIKSDLIARVVTKLGGICK